ncbi:hypothetical protein [Streptomyces sp. NBC_01445]|uniref:hypothetical protein n=1 Tax=Streptomyces sp. NBC_01445 TaxID=2903869 RepID=UPI002DDC059B|nr:hypothetical protein [Streptomyces sp. NBC_01445]WSE02040.1 hypothetical protein OG574_00490 [Streptomyces sp. NBC_01445]WSE10290.1 hypothetical protein OG574_47520 [Streptomyces sp. NBC_01445]WSE11142.1 hypothetical protein OG574_48500 [Streptomyces sp. NBC_01445]
MGPLHQVLAHRQPALQRGPGQRRGLDPLPLDGAAALGVPLDEHCDVVLAQVRGAQRGQLPTSCRGVQLQREHSRQPGLRRGHRPAQVPVELAVQRGEGGRLRRRLQRDLAATETDPGQAERFAQQVDAPAPDLVGRLRSGRETAADAAVPQRPGLSDPYVRLERWFFEEALQAAPGSHRQRVPGQRPLHLPSDHGELTPAGLADLEVVEESVQRGDRGVLRHAAIVADHGPARHSSLPGAVSCPGRVSRRSRAMRSRCRR